MKLTHYQAVHKSKLEYQIKARFQTEISQLDELGFTSLHFIREITFPFSAVFLFWMYPVLKYQREIFHFEAPLRFIILQPLLLNYDFSSYCNTSSEGTKFVTRFQDGTTVISCNYQGIVFEKPNLKIFKYLPVQAGESLSTTWDSHMDRILALEQEGFETDNELSLEKFEEIVQREDRAMLGY
jgi:hypothetical protein